MSFTDERIQQIWEKGKTVRDYDRDKCRKDRCGAWIKRKKYGDRDSAFGWEVDHINPKGGEGLSNLRPLQWKNNVVTGEGRLKCPVTAKGEKNIEKKE